MKPLILASGSPRRAKILHDLGVEFEIVKTEAPEGAIAHDPVRTVTENARAKLRAGVDTVATSCDPPEVEGRPILAADTIVWFDNRIYGKPRDLDEARQFLRELSGQTHSVFTGVAYCRPGERLETEVVESRVTFRKLSEALIDRYVETVRPTDRAGAYDIDESGDLIVESYTGSYENIMGLPLDEVLKG